LQYPADLGADGFDGAQCKTKFRNVLVGGDQEIIHGRQRDRDQHDNNERQQTNRKAPAACSEILRLKNGDCSAVFGRHRKSGGNGGLARLRGSRADPGAGRLRACRLNRHQDLRRRIVEFVALEWVRVGLVSECRWSSAWTSVSSGPAQGRRSMARPPNSQTTCRRLQSRVTKTA